MEELVELETPPELGVSGVRVARDPQGLFVTDAPKSLRLRQGDRLLSARVFFEGAPPEEVARVLEGAKACRVSFCLRRRSPGPPREPPGPPRDTPGGGHPSDIEGQRGKGGRMTIPIPTPPPPGPLELVLPRLGRSRSAAGTEPGPGPGPAGPPSAPPAQPPRPRVTVKEAAAAAATGKAAGLEKPPGKTEEGPGIPRFPVLEVAAPEVTVGLGLGGSGPPPQPPAKAPVLRLPQLEVAVPGKAADLPQIQREEEGGGTDKDTPGRGGGSPGVTGGDDTGPRWGVVTGIRVPSIGVTAPSASLELGTSRPVPGAQPPVGAAFPVPAVELALPGGDTEGTGDKGTLGTGDMVARFAKGLRRLSLELEPSAPLPALEIVPPPVPKPPKLSLLSRLRGGGGGTWCPPGSPGVPATRPTVASDLALGTGGMKLKVPKLSLVPFGGSDREERGDGGPGDTGEVTKSPLLGTRGSRGGEGRWVEPGSPGTPHLRVPQVDVALPKLPLGPQLGGGRGVKLPKFGGSNPEIHSGGAGEGHPKTLRRGGSVESLSLGRKRPEPPGMIRLKLKPRECVREGGSPLLLPRFFVPSVGFTVPGETPEEPPKGPGGSGLKVPLLELVPPGLEEPPGKGTGAGSKGRRRMGGVRKAVVELVRGGPQINGDTESKTRRRRWVPRVGFTPGLGGFPLEPPGTRPKVGKFPDVQLCPGDPQVTPRFPLGTEGTPKFHLPKVELSPQPCGEW